VTRPRLLLVPTITELEWLVKPLLEEWADVASYDAPGVGDEPAVDGPLFDTVARRGLEELDRRRWADCVVVADEFGGASAVRLAQRRPAAVRGLALGHACLSFRRSGERAPINAGVFTGFMQLIRVDYRAFIREDLKIWDPRRAGHPGPAFDIEELADRWIERVPQELAETIVEQLEAELESIGEVGSALRSLRVPLLLVQHVGCVAFTAEGYEDAVAAFPEASTLRVPTGPNVSPEFAAALRTFCEGRPAKLREG
jgi:pimeloyl-ACP methyl ester carboxylesterase